MKKEDNALIKEYYMLEVLMKGRCNVNRKSKRIIILFG